MVYDDLSGSSRITPTGSVRKNKMELKLFKASLGN